MKILKNHPHWAETLQVLEKLSEAGFLAYLAGGCVRDALLNKAPKDFDIASNATPEQVKALYPESLDIGAHFGVSILPRKGFQIEVATFRSDGIYQDGRHPETVKFSSPERDAQRRDFTVNALFYDVGEKRILDYVGGQKDLGDQILRCVGDPKQRFAEDQLRILRALRFTAQLGFSLDPITKRAIHEFKNPLENISRERVIEEVGKLLLTNKPSLGLKKLIEFHLVNEVLFSGWPCGFSFDEVTKNIDRVRENSSDLAMLWAVILFPKEQGGEHQVQQFLQQNPFSNSFKKQIVNSHRFFFQLMAQSHSSAENLIQFCDWNFDEKIIVICECFAGENLKKLDILENFKQYYLQKADSHGNLDKPLVNGDDLIRRGQKKGSLLGSLLRQLYVIQIEKELHTKSEVLEVLPSILPACNSKEDDSQ